MEKNVVIDKVNPYSNMETKKYNGNFAYEFKSDNGLSKKLIIALGGSGWESTLGIYDNNEWIRTGIGAQLISVLRNEYTILIPEKWNRIPGIDYIDDLEARYLYTKENLLDCYISTIGSYLDKNDYLSIVLVGRSEGAALLPQVYYNMKHKDLVKGIVLIAAGGLSLHESNLINIEKDNIPEFLKTAHSFSIEMHENLDKYYESTEKTPQGLVYRQMASFMDLRPFDTIKEINIPILFIHNKNDLIVAVESTMYIENNLPEKPFEYIYYEDAGHAPMNDNEINKLMNDVSNWIRKND